MNKVTAKRLYFHSSQIGSILYPSSKPKYLHSYSAWCYITLFHICRLVITTWNAAEIFKMQVDDWSWIDRFVCRGKPREFPHDKSMHFYLCCNIKINAGVEGLIHSKDSFYSTYGRLKLRLHGFIINYLYPSVYHPSCTVHFLVVLRGREIIDLKPRLQKSTANYSHAWK
jgi:hypothetical protein